MLSLLETAAKEDNVDLLYGTIIRENPKILKEIEDTPFADTPLHVAAANGKDIFVVEMMSLMPSFARKLNCEGLTPLHLAVKNRHLKTAREMIELDGGLIRVAGRGKMTPMHSLVSAIGDGDDNKVDLLIDFVWACPEAVTDVTVEGKTPLHIAVDSNSVDSFKVLFGWVCRTGQNSVLDKNLMDFAERHEVIKRIHKGFVFGTEENKEHRRRFFMSQETFMQKFIRIIVCAHTGMSMKKRNMMLVVATLVATATYQVILQPPSGIMAPATPDHATPDHATTNFDFKYFFFRSPSWSNPRANLFNSFVPMNTLALNLSLALIIFLLPPSIGSVILQFTLLAMSGGYITVMQYILGKHKLPFVLSAVIYSIFAEALIVQQIGVCYQIFRVLPLMEVPSNLNLQIETVLRSPALTSKDNNKR